MDDWMSMMMMTPRWRNRHHVNAKCLVAQWIWLNLDEISPLESAQQKCARFALDARRWCAQRHDNISAAEHRHHGRLRAAGSGMPLEIVDAEFASFRRT